MRDPALTAMLIAQVSLVVFIAPFGAAGYGGLDRDVAFELFRLLIGFLEAVFRIGWRGGLQPGICKRSAGVTE